ncbi:DUF397 domain-containing protein [Kitasatospora sp. NPDC058162]|uniref:DUF397 domain-containing protein n=1 Tax=Kitasatospora sp. NPDC058162 TaxID=3346362 RepID=UPI0036DF7593
MASTPSGAHPHGYVAETSTAVLVRDSKDKGGPHLSFTPAAWESFLTLATAPAALSQ